MLTHSGASQFYTVASHFSAFPRLCESLLISALAQRIKAYRVGAMPQRNNARLCFASAPHFIAIAAWKLCFAFAFFALYAIVMPQLRCVCPYCAKPLRNDALPCHALAEHYEALPLLSSLCNSLPLPSTATQRRCENG
jgi:hypothetical protein